MRPHASSLTKWPTGPVVSPLAVRLFGQDRIMRERVVSIALCLLSYVLSCAVASMAVDIGVVKPWAPYILAGTTLPATLGALWLVRTGRTLRFKDPALMIPQNALALFAISLAYVAVDTNTRGLVLLFLPLVIVFGIYTHTSTQSIAVGATGVAVLALVMVVLTRSDPAQYPPEREIIRFELLAGCVLVLIYSSVYLVRWRDHLRKQRADLGEALQKVQHLAMHDVLTGLINRRQMQAQLTEAMQAHASMGMPFAVALVDLDHFKRINDTHGHHVGDEVLVGFARACEALLGSGDVLARWGGEEFLLLMHDAHQQKVKALLMVLQGQLRHQVVASAEPGVRVSFSAGVCAYDGTELVDAMLRRADLALYEAKEAGRCRVMLSSVDR